MKNKHPIQGLITADNQGLFLAVMPPGTLFQRQNLVMVRLILNAGPRSHEAFDLRPEDMWRRAMPMRSLSEEPGGSA
jgi:hypothetical protein